MTTADRVIAELVNALAEVERIATAGMNAEQTSDIDTQRGRLAFIAGMAEQAVKNADAYRERNSDGYLVLKDFLMAQQYRASLTDPRRS